MRNPSGTNKVVVIGAGFAGLSAAAYLAKAGFEVTVIEKNEVPGGRARLFKYDSFVFDIGCLMFLKNFLTILEKVQQIITN